MAPSLKVRRKKRVLPAAESGSQDVSTLSPEEEAVMGSPAEKEPPNAQEKLDQVDSPGTKPEAISSTEQKSPGEESGDEQTPSGEKQEEQAFLENLYKFMKERHTPIERVPHLGFKQINLFKIYKVVEKLGAYELVTGRRLWKNVYDMLGGNPGSTSAATCTRRHYERLVLPYVRHLKGEGDKPLPPVKPRKQYKVSKEPKGDKGKGSGEKKSQKKEKPKDQAVPEKMNAEVASVSKPANDVEHHQPQEQTEDHVPLSSGPEAPETQPPDSSSGSCRVHSCSEAYKRLFSSFYFKGNHGIMSPLAKKKLLAQVTKDESFYSHDKALSHCPECKKARTWESPISNSEAGPKHLSAGHPREAMKSPVLELDDSGSLNGPSQISKNSEVLLKVAPNLKESLGAQKAEDTCGKDYRSAPPVFNGYFHPPRNDVVKPISCHPLRGSVEYYAGFRSFTGTLPAYQAPGKDRPLGGMVQKRQESPEDQPEDLRRKPSQPLSSWRGDGQQLPPFQMSGSSGKREPSPFSPVKASWVPPVANLAKVSPQVAKTGDQPISPGQAGGSAHKKRPSEEDFFLHGKKLKAVSPFVKEVESSRKRMERGTSPNGQQGAAKPKAAVPTPVFPVAPVPPAQDMYKGTMLRLPVHFSNAGDHLKGQSPSLIPSLSISPFIIPAFPTPLLTASVQPSDICQSLGTSLFPYPSSYDSSLRHRVYPVSTWHSQPAYASAHVPAFHRNTKL